MAIGDLIYVDPEGMHYPDYPTVLAYLQDEYRSIYGQDVYLEADSQDGQWIAVLALCIYEMALMAAAIYNSFSPLTAQGDALTRNVKINGIARAVATSSTVDLLLTGQIGVTINNGVAEDTLGQKWLLPASVTIPAGGSITITATAEKIGSINAAAFTISKIATPTLGWHTVINLAVAVTGAPVESDGTLRDRQEVSTMIPSLSVMEGIVGGVASVAGVQKYRGYENDTNITDLEGIPAHSIAIVALGGDSTEIAQAIAAKKTAGTGTYGTTSVIVYDDYGVPNTINFFRPILAIISVRVTIITKAGYVSGTADLIKQAVVDHINASQIGDDVYVSQIAGAANLNSTDEGRSFDVSLIENKLEPSPTWDTTNIILGYIDLATSYIANVEIVAT